MIEKQRICKGFYEDKCFGFNKKYKTFPAVPKAEHERLLKDNNEWHQKRYLDIAMEKTSFEMDILLLKEEFHEKLKNSIPKEKVRKVLKNLETDDSMAVTYLKKQLLGEK